MQRPVKEIEIQAPGALQRVRDADPAAPRACTRSRRRRARRSRCGRGARCARPRSPSRRRRIGTAVEIVYATGAVEPVRWAKVTSVIRDRITEICDCEGKSVKKDEVLARLDDKEQNARSSRSCGRARSSPSASSSATPQLVEKGVVSTQAHERVSMDLRSIQALILVQMEKIADRTITAPIDGVVLRRDGEVGEIAEAGQILFRVGALKPLQVVAEVNEEDIPRVAVGQTVLFRTDAFPGRDLEGKVREITPIGDPVAKTYRIKVALPDDTPLLPGMSVEANVVTREKADALLVPADAVSGSTVLVVAGGRVQQAHHRGRHPRRPRGRSHLRPRSRASASLSPVVGGLADGDRVRAVDKPAPSS